MARKPNEPIADEQKSSGKFVLKKNHGLLEGGRSGRFFEAGSEFDPETQSDLISLLIQSGAIFE